MVVTGLKDRELIRADFHRSYPCRQSALGESGLPSPRITSANRRRGIERRSANPDDGQHTNFDSTLSAISGSFRSPAFDQ